MRLRALSAVLLLLACGQSEPTRTVEAGRMGRIALYEPADSHDGFVYLFSDASGWSRELDALARRIAEQGAAVVGVDLRQYLAGLAATTEDQCHYTVAELEDWSHRLQRELGFERYRSPILAGVGAGATLAHAALAQSPAATLAGAIGADPAPALATRVPLCPGAPSRATPAGFAYEPAAQLPGFWRQTASAAQLGDAVASAVAEQARDVGAELADLPLVEIPVATPSERFAVIYSGDGGWRDLDKQIGEYFAEQGTPTVGVDSLRYFWRAKTPDEVAADLARIIRHYQQEWHAHEVLLVGYSFGAGILPFAVNRLPEPERAAVIELSLLGLESRAPFEIAVTGWLGGVPADAPEVLPELLKLDLSRVQCFLGEDEEDTLCPDPHLAKAEIIRTPGGHHFDGDYRALARRILDGAKQRATSQASG
jgi:type IV secretory pathway VirJ component